MRHHTEGFARPRRAKAARMTKNEMRVDILKALLARGDGMDANKCFELADRYSNKWMPRREIPSKTARDNAKAEKEFVENGGQPVGGWETNQIDV
jgi:hypothetical protein